MNHHLIARSHEDLLTTHRLNNHTDFPTHISGSSLGPVVPDLPAVAVQEQWALQIIMPYLAWIT